jgi:hypothetical protein
VLLSRLLTLLQNHASAEVNHSDDGYGCEYHEQVIWFSSDVLRRFG